MSGSTFTYVSGSSGLYDWSAGANWIGGNVPVNGGVVTVTGDSAGDISVDNIASISLSGLTVNNYLSGRTTVAGIVEIAAGDTLAVTGNIAGTGTIDLLGTSTELVAGVSQLAGPAINFDPLATSVPEDIVLTGTMVNGSTITDGGVLSNFYQGDTIDFRDFTNISTINIGSTLKLVGSLIGGGTATYIFNSYQSSSILPFNQASDGAGGTLLEATCFAAGTGILTPAGERKVETVAEGDFVAVLRDGVVCAERVVWTGSLRLDLSRLSHPEAVAPVRIRQGAIAEGLPHRDLVVSPEHCLFIDGRLVAAKCLVNGMTIVQEFTQRTVDYHHIETRRHGILLAEGLPAETYLDTGNRAIFDNAATALMLHPEFHINAGLRRWTTDACAPLAEAAAEILPIWQQLADRACALGMTAEEPDTTTDPMIRLRVDGREMAPITRDASQAVFAIPAGSRTVTLLSRASSPAEREPWRNDHRRLGVAVRQIAIRSGSAEQRITADDPALQRGWHRVEGDGTSVWRWTDGCAALPVGPFTDAAVLEVQLCGEMRYCLPPAPRRAA